MMKILYGFIVIDVDDQRFELITYHSTPMIKGKDRNTLQKSSTYLRQNFLLHLSVYELGFALPSLIHPTYSVFTLYVWKSCAGRPRCGCQASVNSTCAQPPPPRADPRALAFFLPWMANFRGWGLLSCQIPRGGDEKRWQKPRLPSTLQHFSLIAQSNTAILSILMCYFLFQLTSSFVIARRI